ncbi:hypothetical protein ABPG74_019309 [Tetrahymena malaccensis]
MNQKQELYLETKILLQKYSVIWTFQLAQDHAKIEIDVNLLKYRGNFIVKGKENYAQILKIGSFNALIEYYKFYSLSNLDLDFIDSRFSVVVQLTNNEEQLQNSVFYLNYRETLTKEKILKQIAIFLKKFMASPLSNWSIFDQISKCTFTFIMELLFVKFSNTWLNISFCRSLQNYFLKFL